MAFDRIINIIYHAMGSDLFCQNFSSLNEAQLTNPYLIVKETYGFSFNYEYTNEMRSLEFFNGDGKPITKIQEKLWTLETMNIESNQYWKTVEFYADIIDPYGTKVPRMKYGIGLRGFVNAVDTLRKMAHFECIENYHLSTENEELKSKIKNIQAEIKDIIKHSKQV